MKSLEPGHCANQLQSRPYLSLYVVLMRLRMAEVYEDAIACGRPVRSS
jgi:hypothetical protein